MAKILRRRLENLLSGSKEESVMGMGEGFDRVCREMLSFWFSLRNWEKILGIGKKV